MQKPTPFGLALVGVGGILLAMLVGPLFSPDEFSWLRHSTSEQAGQHQPGAWIMRTGFGIYGAGVMAAASRDLHCRPVVRAALILFGLGLLGAAIWSNASILDTVASDMHEDWLHSVASGVVGFSFAAACAARLFAPGGNKSDALAWAGLLIAVLIPILMGEFAQFRGLLQRAMFGFSFLFVLREFS